MEPIIFQYIREVFRQLHVNLHWVLLGAAVISFAIMGIGVTYKPKYETTMTIFADNQNVIRPLLEGRAAVTMPKTERIRVVQETMFSPRLLAQVVETSLPEDSSSDMEGAMSALRRHISLSAPADNYIKIAYSHEKPEISYRVVNKITNLFIEESAQNKRTESKSAYSFIDEQVRSYKSQLVEAEAKLNAFEAANVDGVAGQVNASIDRLRAAIDEISINIEAEEVRIAALEEQLVSESRYASSDYKGRVHRERLAQLESQLKTLQLNYRDQHPDIIDVKFQIADAKRTIVEVEQADQNSEPDSDEQLLNPIYEELSNQLATARVNVQTMRHRLGANQGRLQGQYERRARVAANQADLSELTRDYSVTKTIYEDLLSRKEKARISMTLDLAGQGVTYKVLEPAVFPVTPTGARFLHFAVAGPLAAVIPPVGIVILMVLFDRRVKFPEQVSETFPGIILAVLPPSRVKFQNWRNLGIAFAGTTFAYIGIVLGIQFI